jgi:hypothetical protein
MRIYFPIESISYAATIPYIPAAPELLPRGACAGGPATTGWPGKVDRLREEAGKEVPEPGEGLVQRVTLLDQAPASGRQRAKARGLP